MFVIFNHHRDRDSCVKDRDSLRQLVEEMQEQIRSDTSRAAKDVAVLKADLSDARTAARDAEKETARSVAVHVERIALLQHDVETAHANLRAQAMDRERAEKQNQVLMEELAEAERREKGVRAELHELRRTALSPLEVEALRAKVSSIEKKKNFFCLLSFLLAHIDIHQLIQMM